MTILAKDPQEWFTSDWIAGSININPVIVRKELIILRKSGLVESKQGKDGGVRMAKNTEEIYISEIYNAVKNSDHGCLLLSNAPAITSRALMRSIWRFGVVMPRVDFFWKQCST